MGKKVNNMESNENTTNKGMDDDEDFSSFFVEWIWIEVSLALILLYLKKRKPIWISFSAKC